MRAATKVVLLLVCPFQSRQPQPVCIWKYKHRWHINMNAKLSLHFRPEWYALRLHVSFIRFFGEVQQEDLRRLSNIIKAHPEGNCTTTVTHCCRNSEKTNKPSWVTLCEEIKDVRVSTRLTRRANSGLRYQSSFILVSSAIHNAKLDTLTEYYAIRAIFSFIMQVHSLCT